MITLRKAGQRGRTNLDWLNSWHSLSFGDYYDPQWMGFGPLRVIASKDGRDGAVTINQDVDVFAALMQPGQKIAYPLRPNRSAWVQMITGSVSLNGKMLESGDGAAIENESSLELVAAQPAEL